MKNITDLLTNINESNIETAKFVNTMCRAIGDLISSKDNKEAYDTLNGCLLDANLKVLLDLKDYEKYFVKNYALSNAISDAVNKIIEGIKAKAKANNA